MIIETMTNYCADEAIPKDSIEDIFVTGGMLKLISSDSTKLEKKLQKEFNKMDHHFRNATMETSPSPEAGSILNGANILFTMPQFDQHMAVSKKEWEYDSNILAKKLF